MIDTPSHRGDPLRDFAPTLQAAQSRLGAIDPDRYARTRNALDGAVTYLSPYLTHGLLDLPATVASVQARQTLRPQDKLVMEFGWREFFAHVWQYQGEAIFSDLREPITSLRYADSLPHDVLQAATGVPAIDQAVRTLYSTGYLHNHARLWLASYLVHLRKTHWRVGADWLYGHLLDGDLASNHLSWQWVAGTFSIKPYLFNAENVARFAPSNWHSAETVIDTCYEALDVMAREAGDCGPEATRPAGLDPPTLQASPLSQRFESLALSQASALPGAIRLVHPWDLGEPVTADFRLGVIHLPFHARFPWSASRWTFVAERLRACCDALFVGDLDALLPQLIGHRLSARETMNPGYSAALRDAGVPCEPIPRFLDDPGRYCQSFSKFYGVQKHERWHR